MNYTYINWIQTYSFKERITHFYIHLYICIYLFLYTFYLFKLNKDEKQDRMKYPIGLKFNPLFFLYKEHRFK